MASKTLHPKQRPQRNALARHGVEARLRVELERLKAKTGLGQVLTVKWCPNPNSDRLGEVKGDTIYVYDSDENRVLQVLRHEFIDYHVSKDLLGPLVEYANMHKRAIEALIYRRKEDLVDRLSRIL